MENTERSQCKLCLTLMFISLQVRDNEPSSIIAYTLCSFEYKEHLFNQDILSVDSSPTPSLDTSDDVIDGVGDNGSSNNMTMDDDHFNKSGNDDDIVTPGRDDYHISITY